ncbi:CarD family transcriptional regulator [Mesobacillus zeae]
MFEIGDNIIYPMHGAGTIEGIEEKEVLGEIRQYYVIKIPMNNMQVLIPVKNISKSHIRSIADKLTMESVLDLFHNGSTDRSLPWKQRFKMNSDKLRTGKLKEVAEVVRDLTRIHGTKPLNSSEKQMLDNAKKILIGEVSLVNGITSNQANDLLQDHAIGM